METKTKKSPAPSPESIALHPKNPNPAREIVHVAVYNSFPKAIKTVWAARQQYHHSVVMVSELWGKKKRLKQRSLKMSSRCVFFFSSSRCSCIHLHTINSPQPAAQWHCNEMSLPPVRARPIDGRPLCPLGGVAYLVKDMWRGNPPGDAH